MIRASLLAAILFLGASPTMAFDAADLARFQSSGSCPGCDLSKVDLTYSYGLTQEQLNRACGDALTKLPEPTLTIPTCPPRRPQ